MESLLLEMFLRVLLGGVFLSLAVIAWQGSWLAYASGTLERITVGSRVIRFVGWLLIALSVLWLFISIGLGIVISSAQLNAWTPWLATTGVAILAFSSTVVAVLSRRRIAEHLHSLSDEHGPADDQPTGFESRHVWWRSPLGNVGLLLGFSLLLALFWCIVFAAEIDDQDEAATIIITALAIGGEFIMLLGIGLVTAFTVASLPEETLMPQERRTLSQILVLAAVLFLILGAIALAWFGVIAVVTGLVLLLSTLGGRRRATQLGVFWTLTNAVRSGRSSEGELREQAAAATGRTRSLLLGVVHRLEQGANWCQALCRRDVVPESSWLELHGALESGSLPAALEEAVARETRRFSQQGDPNTPRLALGYFGIVGTVMLLGFAFIGYWIVPKLRKIFEDFEVEVPEISQWVFDASQSSTAVLLLVGGTFMFLLVGTLGEMLVDFHGWHGLLDMLPGFWRRRRRAPDLLRGLRWAVLRERPLDQTLEAMAAAPVEFSTRSQLHQAATAIREGYDPWQTLEKTRWLTRAEVELLQSAQAADNLPWALQTLSNSIVSRFEYRLEWWLQLLHPTLVVLLGTVLAMLSIALILPIYSVVAFLS